MTQQLLEVRKRGTDSTIQVRCDRRTLAVLAQHFCKGHPINSISQLVRASIELVERAILEENPDFDVDSVEDAEEVLKSLLRSINLNPQKRGMSMLKHQLEKESAFLEGRDPADVSVRRITKAMRDATIKRMDTLLETFTKEDLENLWKRIKPNEAPLELRMPDGVVESVSEAENRRAEETQQMKEGLAKVPDDIVEGD